MSFSLGSCRRLAGIAALALLSALARGDAASDIKITDAWIRWLPNDLPGGGYLTLTNQGSVGYVLTGASSAQFGDIGIHQTRSNHGLTEMAAVASIPLPPHAVVRFAEGGYHLMMTQPKRSLRPGERVMVTFHMSNGQTVAASFEVRSRSAAD